MLMITKNIYQYSCYFYNPLNDYFFPLFLQKWSTEIYQHQQDGVKEGGQSEEVVGEEESINAFICGITETKT